MRVNGGRNYEYSGQRWVPTLVLFHLYLHNPVVICAHMNITCALMLDFKCLILNFISKKRFDIKQELKDMF